MGGAFGNINHMATPNLPNPETARQTLERIIRIANKGGKVNPNLIRDFLFSIQGAGLGRRVPSKTMRVTAPSLPPLLDPNTLKNYLAKQGVTGEEAQRIMRSFTPGNIPAGMELDQPILIDDPSRRPRELDKPISTLVEDPVKVLKDRKAPFGTVPAGTEAKLQQAKILGELEGLGSIDAGTPPGSSTSAYIPRREHGGKGGLSKAALKGRTPLMLKTLRTALRERASYKPLSKAVRTNLSGYLANAQPVKASALADRILATGMDKDDALIQAVLEITDGDVGVSKLGNETKFPWSLKDATPDEKVWLDKMADKMGLDPKMKPNARAISVYTILANQGRDMSERMVVDPGQQIYPKTGIPASASPAPRPATGMVDPDMVKPGSLGQFHPDSPQMEQRKGNFKPKWEDPKLRGAEVLRPYTEVLDEPMEVNRSLRREVEDIARKENWTPKKRQAILQNPSMFSKYVEIELVGKKNPELVKMLPGLFSEDPGVRMEARNVLSEAVDIDPRALSGAGTMRPKNIDWSKVVAGDAEEAAKVGMSDLDPWETREMGAGESTIRQTPQEPPVSRPTMKSKGPVHKEKWVRRGVTPVVGITQGTQMKGGMVNALAGLLAARRQSRTGTPPAKFNAPAQEVGADIARAVRILRRLGMTGNIDIPSLAAGRTKPKPGSKRAPIVEGITETEDWRKTRSKGNKKAVKLLKGTTRITPAIAAMLAPLLLAGVAGSVGGNDV